MAGVRAAGPGARRFDLQAGMARFALRVGAPRPGNPGPVPGESRPVPWSAARGRASTR